MDKLVRETCELNQSRRQAFLIATQRRCIFDSFSLDDINLLAQNIDWIQNASLDNSLLSSALEFSPISKIF